MATGKLVIWGASGYACVVADAARESGWDVVGFIDDINPKGKGKPFCGATILGGPEQLMPLRESGITNLVTGFGHCRGRLRVTKIAEAAGFTFPVIKHPSAVISRDASVGYGTVVMAGAVVNATAIVGKHVIVNTLSDIEHDDVIGDGAHICPGVFLAGRVHIGECAWVGIGSTVMERISIGADSIIGAGAVVIGDIPSRVVACGVPSRIIRSVA